MKVLNNSLNLFFCLGCFLFLISSQQHVFGGQNKITINLDSAVAVESKIAAGVDINSRENASTASESFYVKMYFADMLQNIEIHDEKAQKYVPYVQGVSCFLPDTDFNATAYDVRVRIGAGQTRYILFPSSNVYKIEIFKGIGEKSADAIPQKPTFAARYIDLSIPVGVWTRLTIQADGKFNLGYDTDESYKFLNFVKPTVLLEGKNAEDFTPPNINFNVQYKDGSAVVGITGADEGIGVKGIWYSFDGKKFLLYSAPFIVNYSSTPIRIEAFADDKAGNRSHTYMQMINFKTKKQ